MSSKIKDSKKERKNNKGAGRDHQLRENNAGTLESSN